MILALKKPMLINIQFKQKEIILSFLSEGKVYFGLALLHFNHCRVSNANSILNI